MKPLDLNFICQTLNLPTPSENKPVSRIVTDSRDIRAGDVFFALAGERFDAHDFVEDVLAAGAAAVVVSREDCAALDGALKVDDTLAALQTLAKAWRGNVNPFVFGITGSGGKTTVKEMLAAVLRRRFGDDAVFGDGRQLQQPHRPSADFVEIKRKTPICSDRNGHEPFRRAGGFDANCQTRCRLG